MNRKYYLLDRNIISLIKDSNKGKRQKNIEKIKILNKLRKMDRNNSFITPILSIIEGQIGKIESDEETKTTLKKETAEIKKFFKYAHTDTKLLIENPDIFIESVSDIKFNNNEYYEFIKYSSSLLINNIKKQNRNSIKNKILEKARCNNIQYQSPFVICCLSVLFEGQYARKVLKPSIKKQNIHNAISDLRILFILVHIVLIGKEDHVGKKFNLEFVSDDKNLNKLFSLMKILSINSALTGERLVEVTYSKELFPSLGEKEYKKLFEELSINDDKNF